MPAAASDTSRVGSGRSHGRPEPPAIEARAMRLSYHLFWFEARTAARALLRNRLVSLFVIATLWLGVTLSAGSILAFRQLVLRPLALPDSAQLHSIRRVTRIGMSGLARDDIDRIAETGFFSGVGGYRSQLMTMTSGEPVRVNVATVTPSLLETLGLEINVGNATPADPTAALIDEGYSRTAFGADRAVLGRSLTLDGRTFHVAGVVAGGVVLEDRPFQVWVPVSPSSAARGLAFFTTIGRLRPDVPKGDAETALTELLGYGPNARVSLEPLNELIVGNTREITVLVLVGSFGILVASCAVVILFLLLHLMSGSQLHGLIMRTILGATALSLGARLLGSITGLVLPASALALGSLFLLQRTLPGESNLAPVGGLAGGGILAAAVALPALAVILICFLPIFLYTLGARLEPGISRAGRTALPEGAWVRGLFLASVVALTLSLGISASLAFASVSKLYDRPLGFQPVGRLAAVITASGDTTLERERAFWKALLAEVSGQHPDAEVGVTSTLPLYGGTSVMLLPKASGEEIGLETIAASPGLFNALGINVVRGRGFTDDDDASRPPVAILNETAAKVLYGGVDAALGKRLALMTGPVTVVGVSGDHLSRVVQQEPRPALWLPYLQHSNAGNALVMSVGRTERRHLEQRVRAQVTELDPSRPVEIISLEALVDAPLRRPRLAMYVLSIFAGALLVFSLGVIAGNVIMMLRRQARDTAIRVAHGARRRHIIAAQLKSVLLPMLGGIAAGLAGALWLVGLLGALFSNLEAFDYRTAVVVSLGLVSLGLSAAVLSANAHLHRLDVWSQINDA